MHKADLLETGSNYSHTKQSGGYTVQVQCLGNTAQSVDFKMKEKGRRQTRE
jgi:hypothetical protein